MENEWDERLISIIPDAVWNALLDRQDVGVVLRELRRHGVAYDLPTCMKIYKRMKALLGME